MPFGLAEFHFLRPQWLWLAALGGLLLWFLERRDDPARPWRGIVAPHLLPHLLVGPRRGFPLRPVHGGVAGLFLGGLALAGPAWEEEASPLAQDKAALVVALDLSRGMDAIDVSPTRLERGKQKVRDLLALRQGTRTALVAFAGTPHLVLPLTEDTAILATYLEALSTRLMPVPGKDAPAALALAESLLAREPVPGTILFVTDGIAREDAPAFARHHAESPNQVVVLGVGTSGGGPIRDGQGFLVEHGTRVVAKLDREGLETLARDAGAFVATATVDDRDVARIQRGVQSHLESVVRKDENRRFKDCGWYLAPVLAFLGGLWFRRGWTIRWATVLLLGALHPGALEAADWRFADLWATHDQQGRRLFERGEFEAAAARFEDPLWKGAACYRAADYDCAVDAFARVETPEAYFDLGNAYAKKGELKLAVAAYDQALAGRPDFAEARANRDLVASRIPREKKNDQEKGPADPNQKPDQVKFDEKGKKGKPGKVETKALTDEQIAQMWLRGVETSPAEFLRMKFAAQARAAKKAPPPATTAGKGR
jgi:Ca-activated chloride channel family protein